MSEIARCTGEAARELTDRIKSAAEDLYALLLEAHEGQAWSALGYDSWRDYAMTEFGMGQSRAYQLLDQARIIREIEAASDSTNVERPNEGQARELARIPEEDRAEIWEETNERTEGKPTAKAIRETWQGRQEADEPEPDPESADVVPLPDRRDDADQAVAEFDDHWTALESLEGQRYDEPAKPAPVMLTLRTHKGDPVEYPQPQGKPTFNETTGEGISWAAWSWNPVTGCLHGCDYCYARAIIHHYPQTNPVGFTPLFHEERLDAPSNTTIPVAHRDDPAYRRVFVCSMADLYGRWIPDEWIKQVHESMLAAPRWEYLLLTKFPDRYPGIDLPPNAWVGTSVDEQKRVRIAERAFRKIDGVKVKWLSLEPLLEPLEFTDLSMFDWVVIGAQTQTNQPSGQVPAFNPPWEWVDRIYHQAKEAGCRVHMKPNLKNSLPNEYPSVMEDK
ncbi:MAG: DUF5131 family protein [Nocardioidaceae bacterium]